MKKTTLVVSAILALSVATPAFAAMQMTGSLEGGYTVWNGDYRDMNPVHDGQLTIKAQEGRSWSAETQLKDLAGNPKLGEYQINFNDPLFNLTVWGNEKELTAKADPLGFVESKAQYDGVLKARLGVGPITADMQDDGHGFLFAEKAIGKNTFGVAAHSYLPIKGEPQTAVGYVRTNIDRIALDAELGMTVAAGIKEDNVGFGVRAVAPILPNVTGTVSYKNRPVNFDVTDVEDEVVRGVNELFAEAKYDANGMMLAGSITDKTGVVESHKLAAKAAMMDVEAEAAYTTDRSDYATTELSLAHSRTLVPGVLSVTGNLGYKADKDGVVYEQTNLHEDENEEIYLAGGATSYTKVQVDGKYTGVAKLTVEPGFTYVKGDNKQDFFRIGGKAGYQISPNGTLTAEYAQESKSGIAYDSKLGVGYEVKF